MAARQGTNSTYGIASSGLNEWVVASQFEAVRCSSQSLFIDSSSDPKTAYTVAVSGSTAHVVVSCSTEFLLRRTGPPFYWRNNF